MAETSGQYVKLPPGWDCKYDQSTGNCYYVNYFTKAMQLEDPRLRYRPLQNERCSSESIAMAPMQGSPYHVYPSNNYPAVRAFQGPIGSQIGPISSSPLLSTRSNLEMSPLPVSRLAGTSRRSTIQETSFSNHNDTDAIVTKIQNMFPTASENHIRLLLKRYIKTIFPKADETLLLDVLANADNNVQTASEKLISMGYVKRDFVPPKATNRPELDAEGNPKKPSDEKVIPLRPKEYSAAEKEEMKTRLKQKYNKIADRIILMALESVSYAEDRASQILQIVREEDEARERKNNELLLEVQPHISDAATTTTDGVKVPPGRAQGDKSSRGSTEEEVNFQQQSTEFKSMLGRLTAMGHNTELANGADDSLLLADYVTWNGANPSISLGQKQLAAGADAALLSERSCVAAGRNPELCKGPKPGLAKGSIYAQLAAAVANIKCN